MINAMCPACGAGAVYQDHSSISFACGAKYKDGLLVTPCKRTSRKLPGLVDKDIFKIAKPNKLI